MILTCTQYQGMNRVTSTTVTPFHSNRGEGEEEAKSREIPLRTNGILNEMPRDEPVPVPGLPIRSPKSSVLSSSALVAVKALRHTISDQVFTAFFVTSTSGIFFVILSLAPLSRLLIIDGKGGVGESSYIKIFYFLKHVSFT